MILDLNEFTQLYYEVLEQKYKGTTMKFEYLWKQPSVPLDV